MRLKQIIETLNLEIVNKVESENNVTGCYIGDLLSNVMANAKKGQIWITIQGHQNVIAVSLLTEVSAVIIVEDSNIDDKTIKRAKEKKVNLLKTKLTAYELAKELVNIGL